MNWKLTFASCVFLLFYVYSGGDSANPVDLSLQPQSRCHTLKALDTLVLKQLLLVLILKNIVRNGSLDEVTQFLRMRLFLSQKKNIYIYIFICYRLGLRSVITSLTFLIYQQFDLGLCFLSNKQSSGYIDHQNGKLYKVSHGLYN